MRKWAIKKGKKYGIRWSCTEYGTLAKADLYNTKREAQTECQKNEKVVPVEVTIKEVE